MNTTQTSRIEAAEANRRILNRPPREFDPNFDPLDTPPEVDPAAPLAHLTPEHIRDLVSDLLEDWDCPTMTVLGLCRAHRLSLAQVRAIANLPRFQGALEDIRAIRDMRDAPIAAAARNLAIDRLSHLARHNPTSATHAKEIRLALKSLIALVNENPPPFPTGEVASRSDDGGGPGSANRHTNSDSRNPPPFPTGEVARRSRDGGGLPADPHSHGGAEFHSAIGQSPIPQRPR